MNKKIISTVFTACCALSMIAPVSFADQMSSEVAKQQPSQLLKAKLANIKGFSGDFLQVIYDEDGNSLQNAQGQLKVSKPYLVNWHTQSPEENLIVSDGKALWLFDPFIEQATVYTLDNSMANTPILLLANDSEELWQQYNVSLEGNNVFVINAKDADAQVKSLTLTFNKEVLSEFAVLDASGQRSKFSISNFELNPTFNQDTFRFDVPEGVFIDDQR